MEEKKLMTKEDEAHPLVSQLEELGFLTASKSVESKVKEEKEILDLKTRTMLAFERYRFISAEHIERFNNVLKHKTYVKEGDNGYPTYDRLKFTPISQYGKIPPADVLDKIRTAKNEGLFDAFEVCSIETHEVRPDPIIFGIIRNCEEKFFIAQWDDDVKIEDIISQIEG